MFNEITKTIEWGGKILKLSTGKVARQADGAVLVEMGGSVLLCTAVSAKEAKEGIGFFPLTVHYREMAFAAGKIPGGFFKREGRSSEREVLVSRLIDRPIRPLFHPAFVNETQVICTVMSYDPETVTDILAIIGASAALALSHAPFEDFVAASKVGLVNGEFVLNPSAELLKSSELELVVAGTKSSVMMVESEAHILSEDKMLEAIKFGHNAFQPVITLIKDLAAEAGKLKLQLTDLYPASLTQKIREIVEEDIKHAFSIKVKQERSNLIKEISKKVMMHFSEELENNKFTNLQIEYALKDVESKILREDILKKNIRIDGRKTDDIRQIACEVSLLPKTHGSSLFTRGETQALTVTTLGTSQDEQMMESLEGEYKERFMLNYIFPPYSVGEATPVRAPGRREIGHGKLAWRAINPVLPSKSQFAYSIRAVTEITDCNGSSSMATVCGTSLALMDAGVPIKAPIAGIAMGLVKENETIAILSDIMGDEDYFGDMDFKVAGSQDGITALQMDIKISGVTLEIMKQALEQAKVGRLHILEQMNKALSYPKTEINENAPAIQTLKIEKDKIREVIGTGGKVIREICETTGAKIDISDDGTVSIFATNQDKLKLAMDKIKAIVFEAKIGEIFNGTVKTIVPSGAFINYRGSKDGFVHISEISPERIESVASVLKEGDIVRVKLIGFDKGKAKLTIKNVDNVVQEAVSKPPFKAENKENSYNKRTQEAEKTSPLNEETNENDKGMVKRRKYFS